MRFQTCKHELVFFKAILSDEVILKRYIDSILKEDVGFVKVLNSRMIVNNIRLKSKTLDALIETKKYLINIEINTNFSKEYKERNLKYLSTIMTNVDRKRKAYSNSKNVIQINLNFQNKSNSGDVIELKNKKNKIYSEKIKIINYNIEYYKKICYNQVNKDELTYLLGILDMNSDELDDMVRERRDLKVIADMIKDINDEKELFEYMDPLEEKKIWENTFKEIGERRGEKRGEKKGRKAGIIETAKNMLKDSLPVEQISKYTGLTKKQIMML